MLRPLDKFGAGQAQHDCGLPKLHCQEWMVPQTAGL